MIFSNLQLVALVGGVLTMALAAFILAWNFPDRLNRAFGLFLLLAGGSRLASLVPNEPGPLRAIFLMSGYLGYATTFVLLYVAAAYRDRYGQPGLRRIAFPILLVAGIVVEVLYFRDHLFFTPRGRGADAGFFLTWLGVFGPAALAALLAYDARGTQSPSARRSLAIASLGFAFFPTAWLLHLWIPGLMDLVRGFTIVHNAMLFTAFAPIVYIVWGLVRTAIDPQDALRRREAATHLGILCVAPATVLILTAIRYTAAFSTARLAMVTIMIGWTILGYFLVAYAIVRHQVFGIERQLKVSIRRGTVATAFLAAFMVSTQFLQAFVDQYSWFWGGLCAALVFVAVRPLSRLGSRLAEAALPDVDDTSAYQTYRRMQVYESALITAYEDGRIQPVERTRLDRLRARLGLSASDAGALEQDFESRRANIA